MKKEYLPKYPISFYAGQKMKSLRMGKGMTANDLAVLLGISQQQLSRYERGINRIDIDTLSKLSYIFNVSINCFFENS